ncbi:PhoU domain-containing protein [Mycoplasmopsis columbina]|uniref:Phosphate transport system regulatory protein n=1 Tax=Mycoplasmopsis columbina SF7 TaxID=1037410 RepID=F9UKA9_9BACT|nr:PhoU domain-containing protein [Mycoplasmopsis columbina]EGV00114.1 phosphate transport system regulatory protein [Mycoplasmopsis columbina SF7]VEU77011.1 Phosphate transport system protein PhoU [Mycoplasmopsis columbina]
MSINYKLLKKSEEHLKEFFYSYVNHSINMHDLVLNFIKQSYLKDDSTKIFDEIYKLEQISDRIQVENFDELLWDISKDQPMLDHLRWYICVLNSLGDIERINDYLFSIANFFNKYKTNMINEIYQMAIELNEKLNSIFHNFLKYTRRKQASKFFEVFKKEKEDYKIFCDQKIEKLAQILNEKNVDIQIIIKLSYELHAHYRVVERMENILENLVFINEPEFFKKKIEKNELI